jgi:hypothetical protein
MAIPAAPLSAAARTKIKMFVAFALALHLEE